MTKHPIYLYGYVYDMYRYML